MEHHFKFLVNNQFIAKTGEMQKLINLLDEAGIPYETRVNILGGTGLRYYGPEKGDIETADIISDGYGGEQGLLECQGLGWDCEGHLRAAEIYLAIEKDFIAKGGTIRRNTKLVIYDWQKTAVITDIDLEHLENIKKIQIDCITGDEIAVVTYQDGKEEVIDSAEPGTRTTAFYDGSAVIYDAENNISLIHDGKLIRPLVLEKAEEHYAAEDVPEEQLSEEEKEKARIGRRLDDMLNFDPNDTDSLLDLLKMLGVPDDSDDSGMPDA